MQHAVVAPLQPVRQVFTYAVPEDLRDSVAVGQRVIVPFGRKLVTGVVTSFTDEVPAQELKPIWDVLDATPLWTSSYLAFAEWIAEYYLSSLGEVLAAALPQGMKAESEVVVVPLLEDFSSQIAALTRNKARKAAELLRTIGENPSGTTLKALQKRLRYSGMNAMIRTFEHEGWVAMRVTDAEQRARPLRVRFVRLADALLESSDALDNAVETLVTKSPKQGAILRSLAACEDRHAGIAAAQVTKEAGAASSSLRSLVERGFVVEFVKEVRRGRMEGFTPLLTNVQLNVHQHRAFESMRDAIDAGAFHTFLLHGVTGSGKTEVYINLAAHARRDGKSAIILVPEISLTPQLVDRFRVHFPKDLAVLHSRMSLGERYDTWRDVQGGVRNVVIGARSALFAPVINPGLIVVDEEHEASYKQSDTAPRYHARDAAVVRGMMEHCVVVLGSATPSLESYQNALQGKYTLVELPERVDNARMPAIVVVDMRSARHRKAVHNSISHVLRDHIEQRLRKNEGVILLQNRRGFAPTQLCLDCGSSPHCPHCAVTLTFHKVRSQLRCHYCGHTIPALKACAQCGSTNLKLFGTGTQRVEEDIQALFPDATVLRMDLDTTTSKGSHKKILDAFAAGEANILLGTQMVAKGLDFPRVTLVGVISADTQLHLPEFRAAERTFQLLTQVAGRAGRRQELSGEVIIQTSNPHDESIRFAVAQDYRAFFDHELRKRRDLHYPPVSRLVLIEFRGKDLVHVREHSATFARLIPRGDFMAVLGPQESPIAKIRDEYRWRIILKDDKAKDAGGNRMREALHHAVESYHTQHASRTVRVVVDVDPQGV